MRPFLDNPPSSYRTEKHLYSNCCLLSLLATLLLKQKCMLVDSFKSRSSKIHFYWQIFITVFLLFSYFGSLLFTTLDIYYYIFLRFFRVIFLCVFSLFYDIFVQFFYFFPWCVLVFFIPWCLCLHFSRINSKQYTMQTDRRQ